MSNDVTLRAEPRGELTVYPIERARALGVDAFVTDRFGGVSVEPFHSLNLAYHVDDNPGAVSENRRRVAEVIGVEATKLVTVSQTHGTTVLDAARATPSSESDALTYERDDLALVMLVADCLPLLLVDSSSRRFSVVHAGWRGLEAGVIEAAVRQFSHPESVYAFIGPSISMEAYQVGPEVAVHFQHVPDAVWPDGGDRSRLDLRRVATHQLLAAGITEESVEHSTQVTDGGEVFFSDRAHRPCGRFALVARRLLA
jgi:YfiH family protein